MTRSGASAARAADRFYRFSLFGLVTSGYLAILGSGYLRFSPALLALHLVLAITLILILKSRSAWIDLLVKAVAVAELLAAALWSATAAFFLFLGLFLLFLVATQSSEEVLRSTRGRFHVAGGSLRRFHGRLGILTAAVAIVILAVSAGLFFLLPRTAHAAFTRLVSERYHLPGFSSEVRLGQMGAILNRSTPVMHVRFVGPPAPMPQKWRGAILSTFDGKQWSAPGGPSEAVQVSEGRSIVVDDDQRRLTGRRVTYEVQLETIGSEALFLAGVPEVLWIPSPAVTRAPGGVYRLAAVPQERLHYGAISYLEAARPAEHPGGAYLQLPPMDSRISALARQITAMLPTDEARATALEHYLRSNFGYTTASPPREPSDPLSYFLFDRREGHCEYFASALAVMLRTLGIPSRLVTGFEGGVLNPVTGWYVVRASDAHAWVEAWVPGQGWVSYDPTPAAPRSRTQTLWGRLSFYGDAAEMFWQNWVMSYDVERQSILASRMGNSGLTFGARWLDHLRFLSLRAQAAVVGAARRYGLLAAVLVALVVGLQFASRPALAWWSTHRRLRKVQAGEAIASDGTMLYSRMLHILKRRGFQKPAWLTPGEFLVTLPPSPMAELATKLTATYHELRFGDSHDSAPRMLALLEQLERLT